MNRSTGTIHSLKEGLIQNIKNIPGWRTNRKIVIIECDDWGGIRMPSRKVFETLIKKGLNISTSRFNRYDTIESAHDLEQLFDVLHSVKDRKGRPAVFTPVTSVANPDFERIRTSGFTEYHCEPFTATYERYHPGQDIKGLWMEGMSAGFFVPELHGRDHITVPIWLEKLAEGNEDLLAAFNNHFVALDIPGVPMPAREFRAEYYFNCEDQMPLLVRAIEEGISLFKQVFGSLPNVFVPSNGIFHPDFDSLLANAGINFLNVVHSMPYPVQGGGLKYRHFITGRRGPLGITYYTRNCVFEPTEEHYDGIEKSINQVSAAFRWGKPAIISTHRVNYVGGIKPANRKKGLSELRMLLRSIVKKWPDVEFLSSGEALQLMRNPN